MPPINPFDANANREGKIAAVLERLKAFFQRFADISNGDFSTMSDIKIEIHNHYHGTIDNLTINEGNKGFTYPQVDESDVVGMAAEDIN